MSKIDHAFPQVRYMSGDELAGLIRDFCRRHKMGTSTFSRKAVSSGSFYARLKNTEYVRPVTLQRCIDFMEAKDRELAGLPANDVSAPSPSRED